MKGFAIRSARPHEYGELGRMTAEVYQALPGMPAESEQPGYYAMLREVAARADTPTVKILVAAGPDGLLLGGVTFIGDMEYYNSGGSASSNKNCSGIRLLAVKPEARGMGVGTALTGACLKAARRLGSRQVILHTTKSMKNAWRMYQKMGFFQSKDLDFMQGELEVFGLRFGLVPTPKDS